MAFCSWSHLFTFVGKIHLQCILLKTIILQNLTIWDIVIPYHISYTSDWSGVPCKTILQYFVMFDFSSLELFDHKSWMMLQTASISKTETNSHVQVLLKLLNDNRNDQEDWWLSRLTDEPPGLPGKSNIARNHGCTFFSIFQWRSKIGLPSKKLGCPVSQS